MRPQVDLKLEVNHTYVTRATHDHPSGQPHTMKFVQDLFQDGRYLLFREHAGTDEYWFEDGRHSSGDDALELVMEVPGPLATPAATPAPTAAPTPIAAVRLGHVILKIDLDAMAVVEARIER